MKKIYAVLLTLCFICSLLPIAGCAAETAAGNTIVMVLQIGNPLMTVNGATLEIDPGRGTAPVILNDRTLVPVRTVMETMGGTADWDENSQTATLVYGEDAIVLTLNSTTAYLNHEAQNLDTAPVSIHDRTMLPIRFIAESFHFSVDWDAGKQRITITNSVQNDVPGYTLPAESDSTNNAETTSSHALVVFFSATGNTKTLAEKIAEAAHADLWEIVPQDPYTSEDLDYNNDSCRANIEMSDETSRPAIADTIENMEDYDTIFLGYPIWWGTLPKIIHTFLDTYDFSGKTIFPFCTSGGSGISSSVSAIRTACNDAKATEGFRGTSSTSIEELTDWMTANGYIKTGSEQTSKTPQENKIRLAWDGNEVIIAMENNATAADFLSKLPMTVTMEDYHQTEKISYLDTELVKDTEAAGCQPSPGTVTLYAPWGNLAIFYKDGSYTKDLIPMGKIESGLDLLTSMTENFTVTIEKIAENE